METIALTATAIIAFFSLLFSIRNDRDLKNQQQKNQKWQEEERKFLFFSEYTRRYHDIMLHILSKDGNKDAYLHLYFDLCSEEYYLHEQGCLPEDVWNMWCDGMRHFMKVFDHQEVWNKKWSQEYNEEFCYFFNIKIIKPNQIESDIR